MKKIPYARQDISEEDIESVVRVLRSDYLTQGPAVDSFEADIASKIGVRHALAVNSATSALHITCLALGLGPGDWLWTSSISFVASANCGRYCGARVDFVDIDPVTYNICPTALADKLERAEKAGCLPRILVVVHMCGNSANMLEISVLSARYGFRVVEDASHALGGQYQGRYVGCCLYSDATIFSFHPVKIITSAEGGMIVTNSSKLHSKLASFRSHGITRDRAHMINGDNHGDWYYEQIDLGYNYRMSDVHAALGRSQLERLDRFVSKRNELAEIYGKELAELPIKFPRQESGTYSSYHLYVVRIMGTPKSPSRDEVYIHMKQAGVHLNLHYIPIYRHPYYEKFGYNPHEFPHSEKYYQEALTLPLYPAMTLEDQAFVISNLKNILK